MASSETAVRYLFNFSVAIAASLAIDRALRGVNWINGVPMLVVLPVVVVGGLMVWRFS